MLELSDIQSSAEELEDYYAQLRAQHVTPAWIGGGISVEPRSEAVPYVWHWRDLRPQAMRRAADLHARRSLRGKIRCDRCRAQQRMRIRRLFSYAYWRGRSLPTYRKEHPH